MRGQYGHGSPSTVTSQAKRATSGRQGRCVSERTSGIAAMSGSCGPWPMSPAAKPAKPAPSVEQIVEVPHGHELRVRLAVHVDELREEELDAELVELLADRFRSG